MVLYHGFHKKYEAAQLFSTLIIGNVSRAANQNIRMISEWSRDTEDWSNDAENSALHHRNKLQFTIYSHRKQLFKIVIIFHNFYCICDQINAALLTFPPQNISKSYLVQPFYSYIIYLNECRRGIWLFHVLLSSWWKCQRRRRRIVWRWPQQMLRRTRRMRVASVLLHHRLE